VNSHAHFSPEAAAYSADHSGERPQVLAQLAKDISDLIHSARSGSSECVGPRQTSSPRVKATASLLAPPSDRFSSFNLGNTARELQSHEEETTSRVRARSPQQVHALLTSIESREAALQQKVQQLMEEKTSQQRRLEDEVARLQRSNAWMEEELRKRKQTEALEAEAARSASIAGEMFEGGPCARTPVETRLAPVETRMESQPLPQDVRSELQQQLSEIRAEVTRCAQALHGPEALPAAEVVDIRQQLAALSNEVIQTSHALLESNGAPGSCCANEEPWGRCEDAGVRQQLESLQQQVSRAMHASFARPAVEIQASRATSPQNAELCELRAEVDGLRAMVVQALRRDVAPAANVNLPPQSTAPEVSALHGRLAALRTEVARVVQGHRPEDMTSPALRSQLGALLQELQEVRAGAAAVAAATASGRGPPCQQFHPALAPQQAPVFAPEPWQAPRPRSPRPVPTPSRGSARTGDPSRFVDVDLGTPDWACRVARSGDLPAQQPPLQPTLGAHSSALLLCPHLAADLAGGCGFSDCVDYAGTPAAPSSGAGGCGIPSFQRPPPGSGMPSGRSLASTANAPSGLQPPRSWDQQPAELMGVTPSGSMALGSVVSSGHGNLGVTAGSSASGHWMPQAAWPGGAAPTAGDAGGPPEEPADRAPQGAMLRPLRTKIPRSEASPWTASR